MSNRQLRKLAYRIYQLTRREIWLGGKGARGWPPDDVGGIASIGWRVTTTWTLSPEVELGGHRMRVCVSSSPRYTGRDQYGSWVDRDYVFVPHTVRVFCDGKLIHPGGELPPRWNGWPTWSGRIARQEIAEGGQPGPVDRIDLLIEEADARLLGLEQVAHTQIVGPVNDKNQIAMRAAVLEVEKLVNG